MHQSSLGTPEREQYHLEHMPVVSDIVDPGGIWTLELGPPQVETTPFA